MLDTYAQLVELAGQVEECLEDMERLIPLLPESDEELDALLDSLAAAGLTTESYHVLFAALIACRQPDVAYLRRHPSAMFKYGMLTGLVPRMAGDKVGYLLWVAGQERWRPLVRATAALALTSWLHGDEARVTREVMLDIYRGMVPGLRLQADLNAQARQNNAVAVCALALALNEPLPLDYIAVRARGRLKGVGKSEPTSQLAQQAQDLLANCTHEARWEASRLLPPTRTDIRAAAAVGTVRRENEKVGRNDPCPCGSGQKHKKCCVDKPAVERIPEELPSDTEALAKMLADAPPAELKQLDFAAVPADLRGRLAHRLESLSEFADLCRLLAITPMTEELAQTVCRALRMAVRFEEVEHLEKLASFLPAGHLAKCPELAHVKMALEGDDLAPQLLTLESALRETLTDSNRLSDIAVDLMHWRLPALGTIVARAALASGIDTRRASGLKAQLRDTRRRLGMDGVDEADELVQRIVGDAKEESELAQRIAELQTVMGKREYRERQRQEAMAATEAEVARLKEEIAGHKALQGTNQNQQQIDLLKRRVADHEAQMATMQEEQRKTSKELAQAAKKLAASQAEEAAQAAAEASLDAAEGALLGERSSGPHPLRVPIFPDGFLDSIKRFPMPVQREAVEVACKLAAGLEHSWQGARKLQTRPAFWRQKVKRDYRIFLKVSDTQLQVIDLVDRKDFERRVNTL